MTDTAYKTTDPQVVRTYRAWKEARTSIAESRRELSDSVGRGLWVNRGSGWGSTRIVGFGRLDDDRDGDLLLDGALIVSSARGQHRGLVVPNIRRKVGKEYAETLKAYTNPGLKLAGMPDFHMYEDERGGMYVGGATSVWLEGRTVYALWATDTAPIKDPWVKIPLSVYYKAKERHDAVS